MDTSPSLLDGLSSGRQEAWKRFVHIYAPIIRDWARRRPWMQPADADDVVSEVFLALLKALPGFRKDPNKRFRNWLGEIVRNKCIDHYRTWRQSRQRLGDGRIEEAEEPDWTEAFIGCNGSSAAE
jgi:RNA polymerase sigma-70 factor (ECF subfamily)